MPTELRETIWKNAMLLDASAAKALAAIIVLNLYGPEMLNPQLPLQIEDRQSTWLVKGTPRTDERLQMRHIQFYVFLRKDNAAIVGYGTDGRQILDAAQAAHWHTMMAAPDFNRVFGPASNFEPWSGENDIDRVLHFSALGGFLNKPDAALDYAFVLLQSSQTVARNITRNNLEATRLDDVWHIRTIRAQAGFPPRTEIVTLSQQTGQLLSGAI